MSSRQAPRGTGHRFTAEPAEGDPIQDLLSAFSFSAYASSLTLARSLERKITIYTGPPNSGKTHSAFQRLAAAPTGAYLAPLRLLAVEARDTLQGLGAPANLKTGEDWEIVEGAQLTCSTIEMLAISRLLDVVVIDEAQQLFDPARGWAWTHAILAAPAHELLIICAPHALPAVRALLAVTGEPSAVEAFERKGALRLLTAPLELGALEPGDAVVSFSRQDVLVTRDAILRATGRPVAVVYGALPSEVRRREAERFASGAAPVLSATDAIGQGLNLPIRRVLFTSLFKFDGAAVAPVPPAEVHQIAGRAGRFGFHEVGYVGVLRMGMCDEGHALAELAAALRRAPAAPPHFRPSIGLAGWHVARLAERMGLTSLADCVDVWANKLALAEESPFTRACVGARAHSSANSARHAQTRAHTCKQRASRARPLPHPHPLFSLPLRSG